MNLKEYSDWMREPFKNNNMKDKDGTAKTDSEKKESEGQFTKAHNSGITWMNYDGKKVEVQTNSDLDLKEGSYIEGDVHINSDKTEIPSYKGTWEQIQRTASMGAFKIPNPRKVVVTPQPDPEMPVIKRQGYDSHQDTINHIDLVEFHMRNCANNLIHRGQRHDESKLVSPEKEAFDSAAPLDTLTYGTPEYRESCRSIKDALQHHYAHNDHHPQHFENGIYGMNLFQIMEMLCDWKASVHRGKGGDIFKSLDINSERFGISKQLRQILLNTLNSGVI